MIIDGLEQVKSVIERDLHRKLTKEEKDKVDCALDNERFYFNDISIFKVPETLSTYDIEKVNVK